MIKISLEAHFYAIKPLADEVGPVPKAMWVPFFVVQFHAGDRDLAAARMMGGGDELTLPRRDEDSPPAVDGAKPREALAEIAGEKSSSSSMQEAATIMPPATSSRLVTPPCSML